jgi:hypothetical protein
MKILIYKRTHKGDPDRNGIFGNEDCMGRIRNWDFDAVIGIGGKSPWKQHEGIKKKINWIGLEPKKIIAEHLRGAKIVFGHFALFEENGVDIEDEYPNLFDYMYGSQKRFDMSSSLPENVFREVKQILDSVKHNPPSIAYDSEDSDVQVQVHEKVSKCNGCFANKDVELTIFEC